MSGQPARRLTRREVADRVGIQPQSVDTFRRRGVFPEPDGYLGRSPWWYERTIDRWANNRRARGQKR